MTKYLFIPLKNQKQLTDSQGKPRQYKSGCSAIRNLKNEDYDQMNVYRIDDVVSRVDFEKVERKVDME